MLRWTLALTMLALTVGLVPATAEEGIASHYSTKDHDQPGTLVACSGYSLNDTHLVAAHRTLPCGTKVRVTNKKNGSSVVLTIIDRGPFVAGRVIDVSLAGAKALGFSGLTQVKLEPM